MEQHIDETMSALSWTAERLRESKGMNEGECVGVAGVLEGIIFRLNSEGRL